MRALNGSRETSVTLGNFVLDVDFATEHFTTILFFFNDTATTEIYTLSLHDALPIYPRSYRRFGPGQGCCCRRCVSDSSQDRKSTRLNSSHGYISYAVFCLKKKKTTTRS